MQKTWARGTTLTMIKIRRNGREEVEINSFFLFYVAGEKKVIELKLPFFGWIDVLYPSPSTALEMLNNFIFITASDPKYIFLLSWLFFFSTLLLLFFLSFWLCVVITVLVRPPCCDIFRCFFGKKNCVDFAATCKLIDWCSHLIYSTFHLVFNSLDRSTQYLLTYVAEFPGNWNFIRPKMLCKQRVFHRLSWITLSSSFSNLTFLPQNVSDDEL